jgi:hypothetical protein
VSIAAPLELIDDTPVKQPAGKIVLDTNNHLPWRDGHLQAVDPGEKTVHEPRQEQLPASKVVKAPSRPARRPQRERVPRRGPHPNRTQSTLNLSASWNSNSSGRS